MAQPPVLDVIIPAFNEENSVGNVVRDLPSWVREVIVVDNNSSDQTKAAAKREGATVLEESFQGYGAACLRGIDHVRSMSKAPDLIAFIDADYSDFPEELELLIKPVKEKNAQMVIGSRALGRRASGSMTPQQVFGNWLATTMIRQIYGVRFTDLGPFRVITWPALVALQMQDKTYGWTVEMQVKAAKQGMITAEIPVSYRKRIGKSKISGTLKGTVLAGYKIIKTILKYS